MRKALVLLLCILALMLTGAFALMTFASTQAPAKEPLKHAYYPFTIEVQVRDR